MAHMNSILARGVAVFTRGSLLAVTIGLTGTLGAFAQQVNTINDGRVVSGGTYYNTPNSKTTFTNSGSGGLWIRDNTNVRGVEVNAAGNLTNNGGTLHFYAPNSVVRVDGEINVNALQNGQGAFLGNGGKVFVDAAYYYQSGNIFANGINGGLTQFNVGSATIQPGATIQARGFGGNGGVIAINSDGAVQIKQQTLLDTSGKVAGTFDSNLINIEGGVVRATGTMRADGAVVNAAEGSRGGTVRLIATGNTNLEQVGQALQDAATPGTQPGQMIPTFTGNEGNTLRAELQDTVNQFDGDVHLSGTFSNNQGIPALISANGTSGAGAGNNDTAQENTLRAGDGGTIILSAMGDVHNLGWIQANGGAGASGSAPVRGGNGGTIVVTAGERVKNDLFTFTTRNAGLVGQFQADGGRGGNSGSTGFAGSVGGKGGLMAFSHKTGMVNKGDISARGASGGSGQLEQGVFQSSGGHGGQGGLIVISGPSNPTNGGALKADGGNGGQGANVAVNQAQGGVAGVIVSPNPQTLAQDQFVTQKAGNPGLNQNTSRGTGAQRPVTAQTAENEILGNAENLILLTRNVSGGQRSVRLDDRAASATVRTVLNPLNSVAAADQIIAKDAFESTRPYRNFIVGSNADQLGLTLNKQPAFFLNGNGEINLASLNTLTVLNDGFLSNTHEWGAGSTQGLSGGHISLLAGGSLQNGNGFSTNGGASGGSINLASRTAIDNFSLLTTQNAGDGSNIHGGSILLNSRGDITNFGFRFIGANGRLIGGTQRLNANGNLLNLGDLQAVADNNTDNVTATGGNIQIRAGGDIQNGSEDFSPVFLYASALGGNWGHGGNIRMQGQSIDNTHADINVNGSQQNGQILTSP